MKKNIINTVLVTLPYTGNHWTELEEALYPAKIFRIDAEDKVAVSVALTEADVAILTGDATEQIWQEGKKLRWIHCNHAGLALSARPLVFEREIILTGSSGRSGPVLAEHTFFLLLSLLYKSRLLDENQRKHSWPGGFYADDRGIYEKTMGIIGFGYIGKEVALRAKAFGMKVLAYDRSFDELPKNADKCYSSDKGESVEELLKNSDVVVIAVRLSDETYRMIDARAFSIMKDSAFLINMARGAVVDEQALFEALQNGSISGCGSDVFETEPLPESSPLWDLPNMIITPHGTPEMPDMPANCVKIIKENIRRYREGLPMLNRIEPRDVYTK